VRTSNPTESGVVEPAHQSFSVAIVLCLYTFAKDVKRALKVAQMSCTFTGSQTGVEVAGRFDGEALFKLRY
jgi:hypothetical protein